MKWLPAFLATITTLALGLASTSSAVVIDFDFEDDLVTPLKNGQIVDPAFDGADLEFGNLFTLTSSQIGAGAHNGATIFDSDPTGPNQFAQDPDLLVNRGNILILQSNNPGSANDTSVDGTVGLVYDNPNDEADFNDRGSLIFDFLSPVFLVSLDFIDANGGFLSTTILTDGGGKKRTYTVPSMWTQDIDTCGVCAGWETLDLTSLLGQLGEGGATATGVEDLGFDPLDVVRLEVQMIGSPSSGGIDNLTFIPEPSTGLLLATGLLALAARRRSQA